MEQLLGRDPSTPPYRSLREPHRSGRQSSKKLAGESGDDGLCSAALPLSYTARPWQDSNLRPSEFEGTLVFTTGEKHGEQTDPSNLTLVYLAHPTPLGQTPGPPHGHHSAPRRK